MKSQTKWAGVVLAWVAAAGVAAAGEPSLKVGDLAPKLQTGKWVQGEPVTAFETNKAYIVEFWATWCGPCRESIPHLNEIYTRFKDQGLVVIGQNCFERDESLVAPFVKKMGEKMTYRVALDDKSGSEKGKMAETWMDAAGQTGIPAAFLVDMQGRIAWLGHPMGLQAHVIEQVLAGKFDVQKAAAAYERQRQDEAKLAAVSKALNQAMRNKDWDEASAQVAKAAELLPAEERDQLDMVRFHILLGKEDYSGAYKLGGKISDAKKDDVVVQNELAWRIAAAPGLKERDLVLAEKCARRGNDAAKGQKPALLDTLARIVFMQGRHDEAIAFEEKAIAVAPPAQKAQLQQTLEQYKKGEVSEAN